MADLPEDEEEDTPLSSSSPQPSLGESTAAAPTSSASESEGEDPLARLFSGGEWHAREQADPAPTYHTPWADHTDDATPEQIVAEDIGAPTELALDPTLRAQPMTGAPELTSAAEAARLHQDPAHQPGEAPPSAGAPYAPPATLRLWPERAVTAASPSHSSAAESPTSPAGTFAPPHEPSILQQPQSTNAQATLQPTPVAPVPMQAAIEPQTAPTRKVVSLAPEFIRTSTSTSLPVVVPFAASMSANASEAEVGQLVRCRACGKSAPAQLALCPHCGRELRPAPSRWLTIGLPAALALLAIALIALQGSRAPNGWFGNPAESASGWLGELSASLDPQIAVLPNNEGAAAAALSADFVAPTVALDGGETSVGEPNTFDSVSDAALVGDDSAATSVAPAEVQATAEVAATESAESAEAGASVAGVGVGASESQSADTGASIAESVSAVALPTQTVPATATLAPTQTSTPLATNTPAPTNTPLPATYTVQSGDTALGIAGQLGVGLDELLAFNGLTEQQATLLQPGQVLRIPGGVVSADTAAGERTYVVREGDTLAQIARINGSSVTAIMNANNMTQSDVFALRLGQTLIIPAPTPDPAIATSAAAATSSALATASAIPPAATAVPATVASTAVPTGAPTFAPTTAPIAATSAPAASGMRVAAPVLRAPVTGVTIDCTKTASLQWLRSDNILADDAYRVHLGFVSGRDDGGNPRITWIVEQSVASTVTQVPLDNTLCSTAPDAYGNQWRWYVDVVAETEGNKLPVSTPSDMWGFSWK